MDSKYTSVGVENNSKPVKLNGLKRSQIMIDSLKVKKIKLSNDIASTANTSKVEVNGTNNGNENKIVKETPQDLLEARRQLPVYMVRNRYACNIFKASIHIKFIKMKHVP